MSSSTKCEGCQCYSTQNQHWMTFTKLHTRLPLSLRKNLLLMTSWHCALYYQLRKSLVLDFPKTGKKLGNFSFSETIYNWCLLWPEMRAQDVSVQGKVSHLLLLSCRVCDDSVLGIDGTCDSTEQAAHGQPSVHQCHACSIQTAR